MAAVIIKKEDRYPDACIEEVFGPYVTYEAARMAAEEMDKEHRLRSSGRSYSHFWAYSMTDPTE